MVVTSPVLARPALVAAALALGLGGAACGAAPAPPPAPYELPRKIVGPAVVAPGDPTGAAVTPTAYRLELAIDPSSTGFTGEIQIDLDLAARTSAIWLDGEGLELTTATLVRPGATTEDDHWVELTRAAGAPAGRIGFELAAPLDPGPATLTLGFAGLYRVDDGLFAQAYRARTYVFSDFEPVDARRAFPCFDEPRFKTPWTVSLVVPRGMQAFANTAAVRTTDVGDGLRRVEFAPTPPLPSYLVAVAVGPFEVVEVAGGPLPTRIIVPEGRRAAAARAAEYAPELLDAAVELLGRPVPFDKLDFIAVPRFGGAMENPGLVTVAADILLATGGGEAADRKLALVLAHEAAHLWFGDWMTLIDWRDLWIQEGLATWMADELLARWRPAWATRRDELRYRAEAMRDDELPDAHALRPEALDGPRALFDVLTYQKSSAMLHMIEAWVGPERFVTALRGLLDARAWGHARSDDLVDALAGAAGAADVAAVRAALASFVHRPGVPVLDAEVRCERDGARLTLTPREAGWAVPACVRWSAGGDAAPQRACVIAETARELDLGTACPAWVHPSADGAGYYRWSLRGAALADLIGAVGLTDRERLDAAYQLRGALADGAPLREVADALAAAAGSDVPEVAALAVAEYQLLLDQLAPGAARRVIAAHLRDALAASVRRLGTQPRGDEPADARRLRAVALGGAGGPGGDKKVIAWARKVTRRWLDGARTDDDLLEAALTVVAHHADRALTDELVAAAGRSHDELTAGRDDTPLLGRALTHLPAAHALDALRAALDGALHSGTTFTLAIGLLSRADTADDAATLLAGRGDWLTFTVPFAAICDDALVDRVDPSAARDPAYAVVLHRRRTEADRCAALRARAAGAAKAFR